jgi:hypothetical protein
MDIRADDGYIVAPPSVHATGVVYKWEVSPDEQKLADVPAWLLDLLNDKTPTPAPPAPVSRNLPTHDAGAAALFDQQIARLRTAPEGARNDTLNRAAYTLGGLVGANRLNPDDVATTLESEGRAAGLTERETLATVASGLLAGMAAPLPSRDRPPLRVFPPGQPQPAEEPTEEPAHPSQPAEEPRRSRFNLVRATEFKNRPAPDCLVEGILQVDSLAALVGPWGSYKSFIALDLSASVATGAAWAGRQVTQGPAIYISAEGNAALGLRLKAWEIARRCPLDDAPLYILPDAVRLMEQTEVDELLLAIGDDVGQPPALVVVDTLARATFVSGDKDKAIQLQEKAIGLADDEDLKKQLKNTLDSYKEGKLPKAE